MIIKRYQHIQLLHRVRLVELPTHTSQGLLEVCHTPLSSRPMSSKLLIANPDGTVVLRSHRLGITTHHIVTAFRSRASSFSNPSAFSLTGEMFTPVALLLPV